MELKQIISEIKGKQPNSEKCIFRRMWSIKS